MLRVSLMLSVFLLTCFILSFISALEFYHRTRKNIIQYKAPFCEEIMHNSLWSRSLPSNTTLLNTIIKIVKTN